MPGKKPRPDSNNPHQGLQHRSDFIRGKTPGPAYHLLMLAVILLCTGLGFWQLERADEKARLLEQIRLARLQPLDQATLEAQLWYPASSSPQAQPVLPAFSEYRLYGLYDDQRSFLLDNRTHQGRVGYHLLTPFRLLDNRADRHPPRWILINRGFIPAPALRSQWPRFATPLLPVSVRVQARPLQTPRREFDAEHAKTSPQLIRIQQLHPGQLSQLSGQLLPAYEFRLTDSRQPGVQTPQPSQPSMPPEKHTGYAVQWFALALVFSLLWSRPLWRRDKKQQPL